MLAYVKKDVIGVERWNETFSLKFKLLIEFKLNNK